MSIKSELVCPICKEILNSPIFFPCHCTFCKEHVEEIVNKKEEMCKCPVCKEECKFVPEQLKENSRIKAIIEKDGHLSEEEKALKKVIEEIPVEYERIVEEIKTKESEFELIRFEHFADLRRSIDLRRENLKFAIDKIAEEMIEEAKLLEESYKRKIAENNKIKYEKEDIENENKNLTKLFRNPTVLLSSIEKGKAKLELKLKDVVEKHQKFQELKEELSKYKFEKKYELDDKLFGRIRTNIDTEKDEETEEQISYITDANNNYIGTIDQYAYDPVIIEYNGTYYMPNYN